MMVGCFDTSGKRIWSSYYGKRKKEEATQILIGKGDELYVMGDVKSDSLSLGAEIHQKKIAGPCDMFLSIWSKKSKELKKFTYYGGKIAVDKSTNDSLEFITSATLINDTMIGIMGYTSSLVGIRLNEYPPIDTPQYGYRQNMICFYSFFNIELKQLFGTVFSQRKNYLDFEGEGCCIFNKFNKFSVVLNTLSGKTNTTSNAKIKQLDSNIRFGFRSSRSTSISNYSDKFQIEENTFSSNRYVFSQNIEKDQYNNLLNIGRMGYESNLDSNKYVYQATMDDSGSIFLQSIRHFWPAKEGYTIIQKPNNLEPNKISLYPNPCYDIIYLNGFDPQKNKKLFLTDMFGKILNLKIDNNTITTKELPSGVYMIQIIDQYENKYNIKFIKY